MDQIILLGDQLKHTRAGHGLDTAHACGHRGLGNDLEKTDLARVVHVGTAAKLDGLGAHADYAHGLAVLLAEQSHRPKLFGVIDRHLGHGALACLENLSVDKSLHLGDLLGGHSGEVGKVEAANGVGDERACLLHVRAQHLAQSILQKVSGGVVAHDGLASEGLHGGSYGVTHLDGAFDNVSQMNVNAVGLLGIVDVEAEPVGGDGALITHLTAALSVEGGLVQNDGHVSLGYLLHAHLIHDESHDLCVSHREAVVAAELGLGQIGQKGLGGVRPAADVGACGACALTLLLHESGEDLLVNAEILLGGDLTGQVDGEAEGVVELEGVLARDDGGAVCLCLGGDFRQDGKTCINGGVKALLLKVKHLEHVIVLVGKLRVCTLVLCHGDLAELHEELVVDAQELAVAAGATDDTTQDVAATLVGGDHAVCDHEHSRLDVVGAHADGDIVGGIGAVLLACNGADLVQNGAVGVYEEHVVHALHNAGETLKTHTRIDILLGELGVVALSVVVELGEHVVPDLHVAVAITAGLTVGRAAAVLQTAVEVDL